MNKDKLNQTLEILLFPIIDTNLNKQDPLLEYYVNYHKYMQMNSRDWKHPRQTTKELHAAKKKLTEYFLNRNGKKAKSLDSIQMLAEYYYPIERIEQIMEDIEQYQRKAKMRILPQENICLYYLHHLSQIAHSLITYRDGKAAIRYWSDEKKSEQETFLFDNEPVFNKVEIWNLLCRFTVPDIYIAIAAYETQAGIEALYEQKAAISLADKLLSQTIQKGLAENHLHFKVGFDYESLWLYQMDLRFIEERNILSLHTEEKIRLAMALFRCIAALYLTTEHDAADFFTWLQQKDMEDLLDIINQLYSGDYTASVSLTCYQAIFRLYNSLLKRQNGRNAVPFQNYDFILNNIYQAYIEYKTSSEFIFLYQCYGYIVQKGKQDTYFACIFLQYLRNKNSYYYQMYERHHLQGLKYFQEHYHHTKSAGKAALQEELMVEIFRAQSKIKSLKKLEIRIAPAISSIELSPIHYHTVSRQLRSMLYKQLHQIFSAYKKYILENVIGVTQTWKALQKEQYRRTPNIPQDSLLQKIMAMNPAIPTLGITFHFLKSESYEDISGRECWRTILENPGKFSQYRLLRRYWFRDIAMAIEYIRSSIPKINEYIVGIDAASDENASEPWMFSMAYKTMRSFNGILKPVYQAERYQNHFGHIQNIGYTYHVGEDFRHLASGFRHIDEVLDEFGFKAGDRLGHALVLGTDIRQWINDNEVISMPRLEHLENLLWIWGINTCEGILLPIQLEYLENEILTLAEKIYKPYGHHESITVKMLYTAYKKKFSENPVQLIAEYEKKSAICCHYKKCAEKCYDTWDSNLLFLTNFCPVFEELYMKKELIPLRQTDIPLYERLQEFLIDKIERMGIYVETNPTSNLSIGEFPDMLKHPIFFLNQIHETTGHQVLVTINSDDPAVFNTNVENEFAYIYYAANRQGISREAILAWIEKIRRYGMEASFIKNVKPASQLYSEINEILNSIEESDDWRR